MKFLALSWLSFTGNSFSPKPIVKNHLTEDHLSIAKLCRDVYHKDVETLETFVESKDTGIQATVGLDGKRATVCLRGSDSMIDWKNNFNLGKVPFLSRKHEDPEKKVHAGFFIGHTSIKAKIYKKLNTIVETGECESILFCGHSAGALSCLLAYDYLNEKNLPVEIVTFGAPRLCNKALADDFNIKMKATRVINDRDVIPLAPLKILGFYHLGTNLIHLKDTGVSNEDHGIIMTMIWRIRGLFSFDAGVKDHDISRYVEEIERCLKKDV